MTVPTFDPALGQWWTPYGLALSMLRTTFGELLEGATVLEPSAGVGAFVAAALECGARHVVAVEIDPRLVAHLRARFADDPRVEVVQADFLRFAPLRRRRFDFVIGNPPYDGGADVDHLEAWNAIEASGRLALTKTNALAGGDAWRRVWCRSTITDVGICVRRPAFSGTTGGPRQIEFAALAWRDATTTELAKRGTVPKSAPRSSSEALARVLAVMPAARVTFYG